MAKNAESLLYFGIRDHAAETLLPQKRAYDWNQALMDFGSLICKSGRPLCEICPLQQYCRAYPAILEAMPEKKQSKKKSVQFEDTDRYIRGRVIHRLRETRSLNLPELEHMMQIFL